MYESGAAAMIVMPRSTSPIVALVESGLAAPVPQSTSPTMWPKTSSTVISRNVAKIRCTQIIVA